jgi:hypothetical protein
MASESSPSESVMRRSRVDDLGIGQESAMPKNRIGAIGEIGGSVRSVDR